LRLYWRIKAALKHYLSVQGKFMVYEFHRISVAIIEDNQPMLELAKSLLLTFGVGRVITAKDGQEGFDKCCAANPDIVIADWMMKPMDGISLTRLIRTSPKIPNQFVPVILMTGFSEKRRVIEARDAGVTEFLVKPFTARDLYRRISQVIERPRQFVRSADFFGPDRRRKRQTEYDGPFRRESDFMNPDTAKLRLEQQAQAQKTLQEIREKSGLSKGDRFELKEDTNSGDIDEIDFI
jgi:CheY-like chemotaxis protein